MTVAVPVGVGDLGVGVDEVPASAPRALVTSLSYLTTTLTLCPRGPSASSARRCRARPACAPSRWSRRCCSRLAELELAQAADDLDQLAGGGLGQPGVLGADDLQLAFRCGVVQEQVQAAALERGGEVTGVVAASGSRTAGVSVVKVPTSGTDTWNSARVSSSTASSASSARSTSSINRTHGFLGPDRLQQWACGAETVPRAALSCAPIRSTADGAGQGVRHAACPILSRRSGCRAAACRRPIRTAPWSRPGLRSMLQAEQAAAA